MAGIIGLLDILLADELTVEQELNLSQIKQCATSLLGLLNDVLDLGKVSGRPKCTILVFLRVFGRSFGTP
jgi:signal transduction histidine kinase